MYTNTAGATHWARLLNSFFFLRIQDDEVFCTLNTECSWNTPKWPRKQEMKQSTQCERGPIALSLMCIS